MGMTHISYYCKGCKEIHKVKCTGLNELPQKCKNCGCEDLMFREITKDNEPDVKLVLGHGGSGSTKFGK